MRTRLIVGAGLAVCAAAATALSQQHTGGTPAVSGRASFSLPATYSGPRGLPTNEEGSATRLPPLPQGVTMDMVRQGDSIFHGPGGCYTCHGVEATGMPDKGSSLTTGVHFIEDEFPAIDSLVTAGIIEPQTRTTIAMPPRGAGSNLTPQQIQQVAAYVWAISHVIGEPWPGGHKSHGGSAQQAAGGETG